MREIISHTSIRGIAALGVVFFHLFQDIEDDTLPILLNEIIEKAYTFVDLFFILSGFILALVYKKFLVTNPSKKDYKHFFIHRFARIYPLHIATFIFMFFFAIALKNQTISLEFISVAIQNVFLVHAWGANKEFIFNFPSWSVSAEFAAYLAFPFLAIYWRMNLPFIPILIGLFVYYVWLGSYFGSLDISEQYSLLRAIPAFTLGMVVYQYKELAALIETGLLSILQISMIALIVVIMYLGLNDCLLIILYAGIIISTWEDRGIIAKFLSIKILKILGDLSFGIYLLHIPIRNTGFYIWPKIKPNVSESTNEILFALSICLTTILVSYFVFHFYEKPARDIIKAKLS